ncbi:MAG: hypothetical protein U0470_13590 [Anaerolineae bacterium]
MYRRQREPRISTGDGALDNRDRGTYKAWPIGWEAQSSDPDSTWYWHSLNPTCTAEGYRRQP